MRVSLICAMDQHQLIGRGNTLPWHLPDDLKHFKQRTIGKAIVMGRKTYQSVNKALPQRLNIVLTRDPQFQAPEVLIAQTPSEAYLQAQQHGMEELVVIGGSEIYQLFLPYVEYLYLTFIEHTFEGDRYFPSWDPKEWELMASQYHPVDEKHPYAFRFEDFKRRQPPLPF